MLQKILELSTALKGNMLEGKYEEVKEIATVAINYLKKEYDKDDIRIAFFSSYYGDACFSLGEHDKARLAYDVAFKLHNNSGGQYDIETIKARIKKVRLDILLAQNQIVEKELKAIKDLLGKIQGGKHYLLEINILFASFYINIGQDDNAHKKLSESLKIAEGMLVQRDVRDRYQILNSMCGIHIKRAILYSKQNREYEMTQSAKLAISVSAELEFSLAIVIPAISIVSHYVKNKYNIKFADDLRKHLEEKCHICLDNNMGVAFLKICSQLFS
jgi:tetratricopeptide (TPR) repeat protein